MIIKEIKIQKNCSKYNMTTYQSHIRQKVRQRRMSDRIIVTFDKSQEDIPVLMSFRENSFMYLSNSPAITVINTITGNEAIEIWNRLTKAGVKNDD